MLKIKLLKQSAKFLEKQNKINKSLAKDLTKKILLLSQNPNLSGVKKLKGSIDYKRVRVGDYRILYRSDDEFLYIILIGSRGDIYKKFRDINK